MNENSTNDNQNKYSLAICDIFNPIIYGYDDNSTKDIETHYLIHCTIEIEDFYNNEFKEEIDLFKDILNNRDEVDHPIIRNYKTIISNNKYIKIDIIKVDELTGQEQVGYIKTFWIKIIQRRWKHIFKERQKIMKARLLPKSLYHRQLTGKWPKHLNVMPRFTLNLKN
jgi:hypothetical protein